MHFLTNYQFTNSVLNLAFASRAAFPKEMVKVEYKKWYTYAILAINQDIETETAGLTNRMMEIKNHELCTNVHIEQNLDLRLYCSPKSVYIASGVVNVALTRFMVWILPAPSSSIVPSYEMPQPILLEYARKRAVYAVGKYDLLSRTNKSLPIARSLVAPDSFHLCINWSFLS